MDKGATEAYLATQINALIDKQNQWLSSLHDWHQTYQRSQDEQGLVVKIILSE